MKSLGQLIVVLCFSLVLPLAVHAEEKCIAGDCVNGTGTLTYPYGTPEEGYYVYTGQFKNGREHGQGRYTLPNGYTFEGEFKNGKRDGLGVGTYANGKVMQGTWKNDQYVGE